MKMKMITVIVVVVMISMVGFYVMAASKPIVNIPLNNVGSSAFRVRTWGIEVWGHAFSEQNGKQIPLYFNVTGYEVLGYWTLHSTLTGTTKWYTTTIVSAGGSGHGAAMFKATGGPNGLYLALMPVNLLNIGSSIRVIGQ